MFRYLLLTFLLGNKGTDENNKVGASNNTTVDLKEI